MLDKSPTRAAFKSDAMTMQKQLTNNGIKFLHTDRASNVVVVVTGEEGSPGY
jgi:hypothetical protein